MAENTCQFDGCVKASTRQGYCDTDYRRLKRSGHIKPVAQVPEWERFWAKVEITGSCWLWTAGKVKGYGRFGKQSLAHRWAYEALVGPIPQGLELDHLCRTPACVNPDHLEPVTHRENNRRGVGPTAINATKTHCANGHPFDEANTYVTKRGGRQCRKCNAIRMRQTRT